MCCRTRTQAAGLGWLLSALWALGCGMVYVFVVGFADGWAWLAGRGGICPPMLMVRPEGSHGLLTIHGQRRTDSAVPWG